MRWNIACKRRYKPTQFYALSCVSCRFTCKCTMLHVHVQTGVMVSERVGENFTVVWDKYWIGRRCRICSYVDCFSRQNSCIVSFWAVRWIPDDVFKLFVIWQLGKEKVTHFINVNFTKRFGIYILQVLNYLLHYLFVWIVCVLGVLIRRMSCC